jgi:hypothetical protein
MNPYLFLLCSIVTSLTILAFANLRPILALVALVVESVRCRH